ncbi:hypothetical protein BT96DRAFT_859149 [Gymnopus androsaceus JB14]|uniref:Uncharacterized protein n=1 Tax=Gymnopus androsaceus JB14 TaxID=1447944 RepID=A0A6A4HLP7_9AGAR|nr:hypothetical protein BT96DRAFT_859149 [Gymnopus androsaceus JB14]
MPRNSEMKPSTSIFFSCFFFPTMKFTAVLLALASTVLAQGASIGAPAEGSSATTGRNITVMIEQPNSLSSIEQVAIVIGLVHCGSESSCPEPANGLGVILYAGPFDPQYATPPGSLPPHQNLSLQVPETFPVGYAQLGVAHAYLLGV